MKLLKRYLRQGWVARVSTQKRNEQIYASWERKESVCCSQNFFGGDQIFLWPGGVALRGGSFPQRLKPDFTVAPYRSGEPLRHPKATSFPAF
jgi:hypothetical protein